MEQALSIALHHLVDRLIADLLRVIGIFLKGLRLTLAAYGIHAICLQKIGISVDRFHASSQIPFAVILVHGSTFRFLLYTASDTYNKHPIIIEYKQ